MGLQAERALHKVKRAEKAAQYDLQAQLQAAQAELDAVRTECSAAIQVNASTLHMF